MNCPRCIVSVSKCIAFTFNPDFASAFASASAIFTPLACKPLQATLIPLIMDGQGYQYGFGLLNINGGGHSNNNPNHSRPPLQLPHQWSLPPPPSLPPAFSQPPPPLYQWSFLPPSSLQSAIHPPQPFWFQRPLHPPTPLPSPLNMSQMPQLLKQQQNMQIKILRFDNYQSSRFN